MKRNNIKIMAAIAALIALGLSACAANEVPVTTPTETATSTPENVLSGTLNAGGSSAQTAAQDAWRADFQGANSGTTINYDPVGSGAGRTGFAEGAFAVVGTDDAFKADELGSTNFALCVGHDIVEVPAYISPIAFAFNLSGVTSINLDATVAAKMMTGGIKKWNDPAIAALNPGVDLPDTAVTPVYRSDKSGTTGNVTDYLNQAAPDAWTWGRTETWPENLKGEAAAKTQGMRAAIEAADGAIGYIDASQTSGLGVASLISAGSPVPPTADAATKALVASSLQAGRAATDLAYDVARTPTEAGAYPMIMVSYLVGCLQYNDASTAALAKAFMAYAVSDAGQQAAAANAGSAPLTVDATLAAKVAAAVDAIH